jgi:hypothetical protein
MAAVSRKGGVLCVPVQSLGQQKNRGGRAFVLACGLTYPQGAPQC